MSDPTEHDPPTTEPPPASPGSAADDHGDSAERALSPLQVIGSTLASAFGVQSSRNRERDFRHGKAAHFIVAGIVFTILFVICLVVVVRLVLSAAA